MEFKGGRVLSAFPIKPESFKEAGKPGGEPGRELVLR